MSNLESMIENLEYDGKLRQPVRYLDFCQKAVQMVQFLSNDKKELYLSNLEAMSTPGILSFGDQLSRENADALSAVKEGCNQALSMISAEPVIEEQNEITR